MPGLDSYGMGMRRENCDYYAIRQCPHPAWSAVFLFEGDGHCRAAFWLCSSSACTVSVCVAFSMDTRVDVVVLHVDWSW